MNDGRQLTLPGLALAACLVLALAAGGAAADEWLVYVGGGIEAIEGGWTERRGQVIFTQRGGTLVSVPADEVDLATSAFVTWQLGGRRQHPPRGSLVPAPGDGTEAAPADCVAARLVGLRGSETLEVEVDSERELVHVACLDAPETHHRYAELGWFGRATLSALRMQIEAPDICLLEHSPPQRDGDGHRILFVRLADGRDYAAMLIASGLGLLRSEVCARADYYRDLEELAISERRGLWGPVGERPAMAAVRQAASVTGVAAPRPRRRPGGG